MPLKPIGFYVALAVIALSSVVFLLNINPQNRAPQPKRVPHSPSGAMEALDFFSQARAYPNPVIPDAAYYPAFEYARTVLKKSGTRADQMPDWQSLGPKNIGGRTLAIAINPQNPRTLYAGSASGGLWRSFTAGEGAEAWHYLETDFPVLGVSTIAIDPADSNVIYIGTGEVYGYQNANGGRAVRTTRGSYGIGILKTTNGGTTWTKSLDWSLQQKRGVQKIAIAPQDPQQVYAATTEGTYQSTDAGMTWTLVHPVIMATDVVIHPQDPNIVFVACGNFGSAGNGIYRTRDAGAVWQKLTNGLPAQYSGKTDLEIFPGNPDVIYADIGDDFSGIGIFRSDDGGDSWRQISDTDIARYQGWYSHFVLVHPVDADFVIAGGIDIWRSTRAGSGGEFKRMSDWSAWYFGQVPIGGPEGAANYSHADHHDAIFHPTDPNTIYFATDGGVFRTQDGAKTFQGLNGGYASTQFYNGFSCAKKDSFLAMGGMQDNSTAIYTGSAAWTRVIGGDGSWTAIRPDNHQILFGSAQWLYLVKSTDGGFNWNAALQGIPSSERRNRAAFIAPYALAPSRPEVMYATTYRVYKSTNSAASWVPTPGSSVFDGNPILALAVAPNNSNTVYCATAPIFSSPQVYRTRDGGTTWKDITGNLPNRYPMDMAVAARDAATAYIVFGGFGSAHLFKSTDAGGTWQDIDNGLPDVPTSAIFADPEFPNQLYLGNDLGVFISLDGGASWQEWSAGLPPAIVTDLSISPSNRMLRVATHGLGVWERPLVPGSVTDAPDPGQPVAEFHLYQNYPNPFSVLRGKTMQNTVTIRYDLPQPGRVTLKLYNVLGSEVLTLFDGSLNTGRHQVQFVPGDLPPGVYFYRMQSGRYSEIRKMIIY